LIGNKITFPDLSSGAVDSNNIPFFKVFGGGFGANNTGNT